VISHGPKFREPQHVNWKHNFKIIMDAVDDYAKRWIKREVDQDPELKSQVRGFLGYSSMLIYCNTSL
jgi:hypothetical protein